MPKVTYDVVLQYPGKPAEVVTNLETTAEATEAEIAEMYLTKLEATLERIETGKRGTLRVGGRVFTVSDDSLPILEIKIKSIIQDPSPDGLHAPDAAPVFTETELKTEGAVSRSVLAVVSKKA